MHAFGLHENIGTYHSLISAYSEKNRYYHTVAHISACLKWQDCVIGLAENINEIELALWFHDAIYNPRSSTNELDSANLSAEFLRGNPVNDEVIDRVHNLIMATLHTSRAQTIDESLMVDIDLSILGASIDTYNQFENDIRKEYKWVPYFIYRKKRRQLLNAFMNRNAIYHNEFFHRKLEAQARINLKNAISSL